MATIGYSSQYRKSVLIVPESATQADFEALKAQAEEHDCLSNDGEGECLVVQFPGGGPIELYTPAAFRRSLPST
jgi:hypothetical protein